VTDGLLVECFVPLKLRPYGAIQMCILLLLLFVQAVLLNPLQLWRRLPHEWLQLQIETYELAEVVILAHSLLCFRVAVAT